MTYKINGDGSDSPVPFHLRSDQSSSMIDSTVDVAVAVVFPSTAVAFPSAVVTMHYKIAEIASQNPVV